MDKPRGRWRLVLAVVVVAAVLIGLGIVIYRAVDGGGEQRPTATPEPSTSTSGVLGVDPADLGALTVTPGSGLVEGISVGYPHTLPGAVSAAVEYWAQHGSNLDPERARTIAQVIADPAWQGASETFANGAVNLQKGLGLQGEGDVPAGYSVALAPAGYQLREPANDQVLVLLLSYLTTQTPTTGTKSAVGVFPALMRWVDGDWKMAEFHDGDQYVPLARTPNTQEAAAAGWKGLMR